MTDLLTQGDIRTFAERLAASGRRRVPLEQIWRAFADAFPFRPRGVAGRQLLLAALEDLSASGLIRLPSRNGRGWDRSSRPAIPRFVTLVDERPSRPATWKSFPWHRDLLWVAGLSRLSEEHEAFLLKVHEGLVEGWFEEVVPLKHRSLQLTRSEKELRRLSKTRLFGPGRLSFDLLGCEEEPTPLAWERIGDGSVILVVENSAAFHVVRQVLRKRNGRPYGLIAYGAGSAFRRSIAYLATLPFPVTEIHYLGDLDRPGARIVAAAARRGRRLGLAPLVPAPGLHSAMLEAARDLGHPDGWPHRTRVAFEDGMLDFYPVGIRDTLRDLFSSSRRIPEEVLTPRRLHEVWDR